MEKEELRKMEGKIKKKKKKDMELDGSDAVEPIEESSETPEKHCERKEMKKKKKNMELDGSDVMEPIEEISETLEKHRAKKEKKRKKKSEPDIEGENSEKSGDIHDGAELESIKDEHRKKKGKKKENKEKGEAVSSSREHLEKLSNGEESCTSFGESGLREDAVLMDSKDIVDAVNKKRKKDKGRRSDNPTFLSSVDSEECKRSDTDRRKKRKRTDDNGGSEYDEESRMEKEKKVLYIEDEGACDNTGANVKKIKKKKKNDVTVDSSKVSPEGISDGQENNREGITEEGRKNSGGKIDKNTSSSRKENFADDSETHRPKKKSRVKFSGDVEVFPPTNSSTHKEYNEDNLVRGRRFSKEEDDLVRDAVLKYVEVHQLGQDGLHMILNCSRFPQLRGCWKEIASSLPWRPEHAVYARAHIIFERSERRGFKPEENEIIKRFHAEHGPQWKKLGELLGKQRVHVKDAWRRIKLPNRRLGPWSQEEYQTLFDLVNLDLRLKAFEKRKDNMHGMLRENISWEAISEKLSTRVMDQCCLMWYNNLSSRMVRQGAWVDTDDYRLIYELQNQDACCVEDIDWDSLLENRSGEVCQKRWNEMCRRIGGFRERTFDEQLNVLSKRYSIDMLEYRKESSSYNTTK